MQPQSDKSMIDRVLEWWRSLWEQSAGDQDTSLPESDRGREDRTDWSSGSAAPDPDRSTVADAASPAEKPLAGATGASVDEFATGGYTGQPTERDDVEAAARATDPEDHSAGVGLDPERAYSPFATDDLPPVDEGEDIDSTGTTVGDLGVNDAGDLDAGELGSLEELDGENTEFAGDASVSAATDLVDQENGSLSDPGHDASDYTTSATQEQGIRIVDEDDPGITMGQETESDFGTESPEDNGVDSGTDVESTDADSIQEIENEVTDYAVEGASVAGDERLGDALDNAALSDAEFETPGVPDEFVGRSANLDLESSTDVDAATAETTEERGATGELEATEFGGQGAAESEEYIGLFGTSDIDTTDLSYLDDAEERRFDFTAAPGAESAPGVADDIGTSPTDMMDAAGAVPAETDGEFLADGSGGDSADFDTSGARDDAGVPSSGAAASGAGVGAAATGSATGGRKRGDDSGGCPADFPIKGNASSKIYHLPDIPSYQGTKAGWCFATEADAMAAGYRAPAGHRNRAAGGGGAAPAADRASTEDTTAIAAVDEPQPTTTIQHAEPGDDEQSLTAEAEVGGDDFGSGDDDIESLQHLAPDDVASEYADASPEGGEQLTAGAEVVAALESQEDVDAHLTLDDSTHESDESLYAGSVKGDGTRECPTDYPIKGNAGSMIYHAPGRASYQATISEWCFATAEDAENAGFRAPKR